MRRQVQECKGANSIGWVGPIGYGNTSVVEIVCTRTPSDKDVPHPSTDTSMFQIGARRLPNVSRECVHMCFFGWRVKRYLDLLQQTACRYLLNLLCTFLIITSPRLTIHLSI
ncbi:hypothetical protein M405DRAFT_808953, partial [Rhizopogon salebrosus TDB-379]